MKASPPVPAGSASLTLHRWQLPPVPRAPSCSCCAGDIRRESTERDSLCVFRAVLSRRTRGGVCDPSRPVCRGTRTTRATLWPMRCFAPDAESSQKTAGQYPDPEANISFSFSTMDLPYRDSSLIRASGASTIEALLDPIQAARAR